MCVLLAFIPVDEHRRTSKNIDEHNTMLNKTKYCSHSL